MAYFALGKENVKVYQNVDETLSYLLDFTRNFFFLGDGTRKGNGACQCDRGFSGETCDKCAIGFYKPDSNDNNELKCLACHKGKIGKIFSYHFLKIIVPIFIAACLDQCTGPQPSNCLQCKKGYVLHTELGCHDGKMKSLFC